jgi:NAD(P)-dependent dehydrogenase (short-subunit alcohol dehydrogenase family)
MMTMAPLRNDFHNKAVIITGGTQGIGLATGLAFGKHGANVYLTHRWGTGDEDAIRRQFADVGAPEPQILEADVAQDEDTSALLDEVAKRHDGVEVLISNVSFAQVCKDFSELSRRDMARSMKYSAWPFVSYLQAIKAKFNRLPRYAIGMSSRGPEYFLPGYDFVATSKIAMETYCRYLSVDLAKEDIRLNVIRANPVETISLEATFGPEFAPFCKAYYGEHFFVSPQAVADAALGLCSGYMDAMKGQVLLLDNGCGFGDNIVRLFSERQKLGLSIGDKG